MLGTTAKWSCYLTWTKILGLASVNMPDKAQALQQYHLCAYLLEHDTQRIPNTVQQKQRSHFVSSLYFL